MYLIIKIYFFFLEKTILSKSFPVNNFKNIHNFFSSHPRAFALKTNKPGHQNESVLNVLQISVQDHISVIKN